MANDRHVRCPVCDMRTDGVQYTLEYKKMYFHFCSEQCRETFKDHPDLYIGKRAKEQGEVIKSRRLRLAEAPASETSSAMTENLRGLMGVKEVQLEGRLLSIRYDLLCVTLANIEQSMSESGVALDNGWWQRLRRAWTHNTESNELDNLASTPGACCNRPPPRI